MKISLCSVVAFFPNRYTPTGERGDRLYPPKLAIVSLIKYLEKNGYPREKIDFYDIDMLLPLDQEIERYFLETRPAIIGLSAILASCYGQAKRVAAIARRACPDAWIILGGHLAAASNVLLRKTDIDFCVAGDGEVPLLEFVRYVERNGRERKWEELSRIPGLAYLDEDGELAFNGYHPGVPESELVLPDYDILLSGLKNKPHLLENYFREGSITKGVDPREAALGTVRAASLVTSKGCVAKCTFCQRATKGWRRILAETVERHVVELKERFGVNVLSLYDENFGSDVEHAREMARIFHRHGMMWSNASARVSTFKAEDLKFLYDHNCMGLTFGLESGSQTMLDAIEKKISTEQTLSTYRAAADAGLFIRISVWLVGNPGDTEETVMETGRLCGRIAHVLGIHPRFGGGTVSYVMPVPGTPLYEYAQHVGVIPTDVDGEEAYMIHLDSLRQATKHNYCNVNGAPAAEMHFWDILLRLEASRTFREMCRKAPPRETHATLANLSYLKDVNERLRFREKVATLAWLQDNVLVDSLPRWLVYPAAKYLNYVVNVLLKKSVKRLMGHKRRAFTGRAQVRYQPDPAPEANARTRSIRAYLRNAAAEPATKTERSRRLLMRGQ